MMTELRYMPNYICREMHYDLNNYYSTEDIPPIKHVKSQDREEKKVTFNSQDNLKTIDNPFDSQLHRMFGQHFVGSEQISRSVEDINNEVDWDRLDEYQHQLDQFNGGWYENIIKEAIGKEVERKETDISSNDFATKYENTDLIVEESTDNVETEIKRINEQLTPSEESKKAVKKKGKGRKRKFKRRKSTTVSTSTLKPTTVNRLRDLDEFNKNVKNDILTKVSVPMSEEWENIFQDPETTIKPTMKPTVRFPLKTKRKVQGRPLGLFNKMMSRYCELENSLGLFSLCNSQYKTTGRQEIKVPLQHQQHFPNNLFSKAANAISNFLLL